MWDFLLVLGQIPGTNIQITFLDLVGFCLLLLVTLLVRKKHLKLGLSPKSWTHAVRHWRSYLLVKKGTQLKLPV